MDLPKKQKSNNTIYKTQNNKDKNEIFRILNKYLLTRDEIILKKLCEDKEQAEKMKYKFYNYILSLPSLLIYVNKYLNHIYMFNSYSNEDFFRTFSLLLKISGINDLNFFYFATYKNHDPDNFFKTIKEYYNIHNNHLSNDDLSCLYQLYKENIITSEYILNLRLLLDGKEIKEKSYLNTNNKLELKDNIDYFQETKKINGLPIKIKELINNSKQFLINRQTCKICPLNKHNEKLAILDTNIEDYNNPIDIIFIGLHPTLNDIENELPFSSIDYKVFNDYLKNLIEKYDLKYLLINSLICNSDIIDSPSLTKYYNNCKEIESVLLNTFSSKIIVLLGEKVCKLHNIKGPFSKSVNTIINNKAILIDPVNINKKNIEKLNDGFILLDKLFSKIKSNNSYQKNDNKNINLNTSKLRIKEDQIVTKLTNEYTIYDVKTIGNQVVYILKDKNNIKKYHFEDIKIPIFIKKGEYKDCKFQDSEHDFVCYINEKEKDELNKKLRINMYKLIGLNSSKEFSNDYEN